MEVKLSFGILAPKIHEQLIVLGLQSNNVLHYEKIRESVNHLNIDLETFSSVDLKKLGLYRYAQSPDFEILLFAYSWDGGQVKIIDLAKGEVLPGEIVQALYDPLITKHAFNATFEWYCLSVHLGKLLDIRHWRCTMVAGSYCGLPMGLSGIAPAVGLPLEQQKMGVGGALIRTFCVPTKPTASNGQRTRTYPHHEPEKWELFKHYCIQDVVTETAVAHKLRNFPLPAKEQEWWEIDALINFGGIEIDLALVAGALKVSEESTLALVSEAMSITGLSNPNSVRQLSAWLTEELGEEVKTLTKAKVKEMLSSDIGDETVNRVLALRLEMSKTSVSKYSAIANCVCADGRVRGLLQFYGTHTGRWAGRLVQIQNLPKNYLPTLDLARTLVWGGRTDAIGLVYGNVPDTLSQLIRSAFVPSRGRVLVVCDFAAIEARILAYVANEKWRMDVFATHGKIYEASASAMFNIPLETITKEHENYKYRAYGKVAELGLGFGGSVGALMAMGALDMGVKEEELQGLVDKWRSTNPNIVRFWYALQNTIIDCIKTGVPGRVGCVTIKKVADTGEKLCFLQLGLPSGRDLFYATPHLGTNRWGGESIGFWGVNSTTKKWTKQETYSGKICENVVQGIARDCLAIAIERVWKAGYKIVGHIHDEILVEGLAGDLTEVKEIMESPIPWAKGLTLRAAGFENSYYKKE